MRQIVDYFPADSMTGLFLNLGCGAGDDTFRFLRDFPQSRVMAIDGAPRMIDRAQEVLRIRFPEFRLRVEFHVAYVPGPDIPVNDYAGIISNSLLHHFHDPEFFGLRCGNMHVPAAGYSLPTSGAPLPWRLNRTTHSAVER